MTKEEILTNKIDRNKGYGRSLYDVSGYYCTNNVMECMDEWAGQQQFKFAQWVSSSDWAYLPSISKWCNEEDEENITLLTTKELYQIFSELNKPETST